MKKRLNELTLIEALEGLRSRKFTSEGLVLSCFEQIEKYDARVKAFLLTRKEDALKEAKVVAEELAKDPSLFERKPLLGIPYACKDNFCTQGVETTAGSIVLKGFIPSYESTVTLRLKEAGAILIGKTNMDAWAHGISTETSDFFSTKNPWDLTKVPGGSSGGSGAAVASNMCIFAIGSETGGSIRVPASWCGITGYKSSFGRVSRYGLIAMASSTDCPGPLAKSLADAALVLRVIAGKDESDATTSPNEVKDYLKCLEAKDLTSIRIGKPKSYFEIDASPEVLQCVEEALKEYEKLGAQIIAVDLLPPKFAIAVYTILQRSEVSSNLARYDGIRYGNDRSAFGFEARKRMMLGAYALSAGYYDKYYSKAQKVRTLIVEDFKKVFEKVDVIVSPNMPNTAPEFGLPESSPMFAEILDLMHLPSALAGLPVAVVPCGHPGGMPIGMQVIGDFLDEEKVFQVAGAFQNVTSFHREFPAMEKLI